MQDFRLRRSFGPRVALFFAALFLIYGVHVPYLPVWLNWRGLSNAEIGIITAVPFFLRVLVTPAVALSADWLADHRIVVSALHASPMTTMR